MVTGDNNGRGPHDIPLPGLELPGPGQTSTPSPAQDGHSRPRPGRARTRTRASAPAPQVPTHSASGALLPTVESTTPQFGRTMFSALTGRPAAGRGDSIRAQLITAFGASRRDPDRPDTAAAAKALGVSQRSVQRWVAGQGISPQHTRAVSTRARQAMSTKRGRARAIAAGGSGRPPGRSGQGLIIGGVQGVKSSIADNYRDRETAVRLSDEDLAGLQAAWVEHGDTGAAAWMHQHWDSHYVSGWHFSEIDDVRWGDTRNY